MLYIVTAIHTTLQSKLRTVIRSAPTFPEIQSSLIWGIYIYYVNNNFNLIPVTDSLKNRGLRIKQRKNVLV